MQTKSIKAIIWRFLRMMDLGPIILRMHPKSGLLRLGWYRSFRAYRAVDRAGNPIPWYTYGSINFLEERLTADMRVFEYGGGNSTLWYSERVQEVIAVEDNQNWGEYVSARLPIGNTIVVKQLEQGYLEEPELHQPFDIIVIDGIERVKCAPIAVRCLNNGGVIIWDDSDWEEYASGYTYLREEGFSELKFFGSAPITFLSSQTSIFYRRSNNVLDI